MQRQSFAQWPCSVARVMDVLGDPWTPLVVRDAFHGIRRFDDFQRSLGIARNTLADRLKKLVDGGILEAVPYQDNPPRNEYVLTGMGADFFPVMAAMLSWGDRWLGEGLKGAPVQLLHGEGAGHVIEAEVTCACCHEPVTQAGTAFRLGPGYPATEPEGVPTLRGRFPAD